MVAPARSRFAIPARVYLLVRSNSRLGKNFLRTLVPKRLYARFKRGFDEIILSEIERANRYGDRLSLAMLDVDHFKRINDAYGHVEGDRVLKEVASLVKANLRKTDCVARWGGEEFVIIAIESDLETALIMAEKVRQVVEAHTFRTVGQVTVSLGVTQFKENDTTDSLISRADQALYRAKENGRNRVESI